MNTIVIDANILISALIKDGIIRRILANFKINFLFPDFGLNEIYSCKTEIIRKAKVSEKEFDILLLRLLKYVRLIPFDIIVRYKKEADSIIGHIDKEDTAFIATALAFNAPIWSDDKHFQQQNKVKVLTTKDIISFIG